MSTTVLRKARSEALLSAGTSSRWKKGQAAFAVLAVALLQASSVSAARSSASRASQSASMRRTWAADRSSGNSSRHASRRMARLNRCCIRQHKPQRSASMPLFKVPQLVGHAQLSPLCGSLHLGAEAVTDPDLRAVVAHDLLDPACASAVGDQMVAGLGGLKDPVPLIVAVSVGSGLIAPDHRAGPDALALLSRSRLQTLGYAANDAGNRALTDLKAEELCHQLLQML